MEEIEKERLAENLAKNAKRAMFVVKCAFFVTAAIALGLIIFVTAGYFTLEKTDLMIGLAVFMGAVAISLAVVVAGYFIATKNLNKLKKLK